MTIAHGDTATLSVMSAAIPQRHRRRARGVGNVLRSHARDLRRRSILQLDGGKQQDRGVARDRHLRRLPESFDPEHPEPDQAVDDGTVGGVPHEAPAGDTGSAADADAAAKPESKDG